MSKHLAQSEKKKNASSHLKLPRVPEKKNLPPRRRRKKHGSALEGMMLTKTLDKGFNPTDLILDALAFVLLITAYLLPTSGLVRLLSFIVPFLLSGYDYLIETFQEAFMGSVLGREIIITLACLLAFCAGAWFGAAAIAVFLKAADLALAYVESKQNEKISALRALCPDTAKLVGQSKTSLVSVASLGAGSEIEVFAGEVIPADGIVLEGTSVLDASTLVGESLSFPVAPGSAAVSGSTNVNAPLRIRLEREQAASLNGMMLRAAENAWMHRSAQERLLQRVLSYLSPALVLFAVLLAVIPSILTGEWRQYLVRAAILLTVSQTYSVVQGVKLSFDCAAAAAAAAGIVVKGHDVLESLSRAETMVFDKTGTITEGEYRIKEVFPRGVKEGQLLFLAGAAELQSPHPIARAIVAASGAYASEIAVEKIAETPGRGVSAFINGSCVYVGNAAMMEEHDIRCDSPSIPGTAIHVAVDGRYLGHIVLEDAVRDSAFDVIEELRVEGVGTSVLLTGDIHSTARRVASALNFDLVKAELTPAEKCASVEYLMSNRNINTTLAFIGDGVCDDEALRLATVGIALGSYDKPEAVEAADAAILAPELRVLPKLYRLAKRVSRAAMEQTIVCGAVKLLVLIFGAAGLCPLSLAAAIQAAAILIEVFFAFRLLHDDGERRTITRKGIDRT